PLSFAQQRLWFIYQIEPETAPYHLANAVVLKGSFDEEAFRRALATVIERHETLRTVFRMRQGSPVAVVEPFDARPLPLQVSYLDALDAEARAAAVKAALEAIENDPFDLERDWPVRLHLLRIEPETWGIAIVMHHIISDARSVEVFFRELSEAYDAEKRG